MNSINLDGRPELIFQFADPTVLEINITGKWVLGEKLPSIEVVKASITPVLRAIHFRTDRLIDWDSRFLNFVNKINKLCSESDIQLDFGGLPGGAESLIRLANTVPESAELRRPNQNHSRIQVLFDQLNAAAREAYLMIEFVGEIFLVLVSFVRGKAQYRPADLGIMLEDCGPRALPIVTLISVLVGLILAFIGAVQLNMFGAQIYVANLVALGMTREMGAMMTAVILAGRTGAAYAAQLGSMQANDEIDALKTMGISPIEFLVLPRFLALMLMLPLLCLYADFMGILGGFIVGVGLLDISLMEYYHQTVAAMGLNDFAVGIIKSVIFGVLVAAAGCLRGMQCGRNSAAVGAATTSAVVTAIVAIVVADAIMALIYDAIGI